MPPALVTAAGHGANVHFVVCGHTKLRCHGVELGVALEKGPRGVRLDALDVEEERAAVVGFVNGHETIAELHEARGKGLKTLRLGVGEEVAPKEFAPRVPARLTTHLPEHGFELIEWDLCQVASLRPSNW